MNSLCTPPSPVARPPTSLFSETIEVRCLTGRAATSRRSAPDVSLKVAVRPQSFRIRRTYDAGRMRYPAIPIHCISCKGPGSKGPNSSNSSTRRWDNDDGKYVEAHVVEAVSLLPSRGQLFMTLANGGEVELDHVNPPKGRLLYRSRNPTIFLKIDCEAYLLLPIVVGDLAVGMLMKALHGDENTVRPNHYHLIKDLVGALNFEVRMIRVTERVMDTYHARIYLGRPGEEEMQSVDARPSDAINLAVRCKVPIYVNKDIVSADAVRPVYAVTQTSTDIADGSLRSGSASSLDCPESGPDPIAEEITLMKNMLLAVVEERYTDAARWRDDLNNLRALKRRIRQM